MSGINLRLGGMNLNRRRMELEFTLKEIERLTDGLVNQVEGSRLENASIKRPTYEPLHAYGKVLGWTPNTLASKFGLWAGEDPEGYVTPDVVVLRQLLQKLPETERDELVRMFLAILHTKIKE